LRKVTLVLAAVLGCGVAAAGAQEQAPVQSPLQPSLQSPAPSSPEARWSFKRVDDGFVRLDNTTGQVAHCTPRNADWTCQAVAENRAALEKQVVHLQAQVASLKKEITALRAARPSLDQESGVSLRMPTHQDIAHARDYLADSWRRLVQMIKQFQHDVLRDG
jgi:peptidoglycan hydrolase CwlO-like protein